jgi:hypothetical protein
MTCSEAVPSTMAIRQPLFPLAALLVTIVYNSPLERLVSSMLMWVPILAGNTSHLSAWSFSAQEHNRLVVLCNVDLADYHRCNKTSQGNDFVSGKYPISPFKKVAKSCVYRFPCAVKSHSRLTTFPVSSLSHLRRLTCNRQALLRIGKSFITASL